MTINPHSWFDSKILYHCVDGVTIGSGVTIGYVFIRCSKLALLLIEGDLERPVTHTTNRHSEQMCR